MGPFALMDLIGHDVNFAVTRSVYDGMSQDARYKPSLVQEELVNAGLLGRKSGRGFYDYRKDAQPALPADCPAGPKPGQIIVEGDLGPAGVLVGLARAAGIAVCVREGAGSFGLTARPWRSLTVGPPLNGWRRTGHRTYSSTWRSIM